ncbi:MAG: hypothetical protein LBH44_03970 [Treponema sp.]|jgi:hypothetical protein|nr:hypothetical protein [Treponema sp.]
MSDFVEMRIIEAVRGLLTGRVNELLGTVQYAIPIVEIGDYTGASVVSPTLALASCERSEKERIIKLDVYSLTITFTLPETPDSELHCYVYAWAVCKALEENTTLGGVVDRAVISGKKYIKPKKVNCGQGWELAITLRVTVEGMGK